MITESIDRLRELKRQGAKLTPLQSVVLDAFYTHDPDALDAAKELEGFAELKELATSYLNIHARNGFAGWELKEGSTMLDAFSILDELSIADALKEQK